MSIEELSRQADVPVRTIRYYITEGLLPGPGSRGKNTVYSEEHLLRLLLIRRLAEQHMPLQEIRSRVSGLSLSDIRALLRKEGRLATEKERVEKAGSPKDYISALLRSAQSRRSPEGQQQSSKPMRYMAPPPPQAEQSEETEILFSVQEEEIEPDVFAEVWEEAEPGSERFEHTPRQEVWRRIELAPGIELQIREDEYRARRDLIDQLIATARRYDERGSR